MNYGIPCTWVYGTTLDTLQLIIDLCIGNERDSESRGSLNFSPMNLGTWDGACDISVTRVTRLVRDNATIENEQK